MYFADVASVAGFGIGSVATFDVDFTAGSAAFSGAVHVWKFYLNFLLETICF